MLLEQLLEEKRLFLDKKGDFSARRVVEELLSHILNCPRDQLYFEKKRILSHEEVEQFHILFTKYLQKEPLEYLVERVDFRGLSLKIDNRALIPRQESEILIEKIESRLLSYPLDNKVLVDLCAGSGCLGLALKKRFPMLDLHLIDFSKEATSLIRENGKILKMEFSIHLSDLLSGYCGPLIDFFVCNPPYISQKDFEKLDSSVRDFEPHSALIGGEDGLEYYRRIEKELPTYLAEGALLFFEIGYDQAEAVMQIFNRPCWVSLEIQRDLAGIDRFFFLEYHSKIGYPVGPISFFSTSNV